MSAEPSATGQSRIGQDLFEVRLTQELLSRGLITPAALEEALRQQVVLGGQLATNLWELRVVDGKTLTELSAQILGVAVADTKALTETPEEVRRLFTRDFVEKNRILPMRLSGPVLQVATAEPWDMLALGRAAYHGGHPVEPYFLPEVPLAALMEKLYEIPTTARFWLGVQSNERRKAKPAQSAAPGAAPAPRAQGKTQLTSFVSAEIEKLRGGRARRGGAERLIVPPLEEPDAKPEGITEALPDAATAIGELDAATHRDAVGTTLLRLALSRGRRAALLVRRPEMWAGWLGAGLDVDPHKLATVKVSTAAGTIFGLVAETGAHYLGPLVPHTAYAPLLMALGGGLPRTVLLLPVHAHGRVIFGVYIDGGADGFVSSDIADIVLLAQRVPGALERLVKARVRGTAG